MVLLTRALFAFQPRCTPAPGGEIVATMRLCTAFILLMLVASIPVAAQTAVPKATKAIDTIEDIEIGMAADPVIAALTKQGYALADEFKPSTGDPALGAYLSKTNMLANSTSNTDKSRA